MFREFYSVSNLKSRNLYKKLHDTNFIIQCKRARERNAIGSHKAFNKMSTACGERFDDIHAAEGARAKERLRKIHPVRRRIQLRYLRRVCQFTYRSRVG